MNRDLRPTHNHWRRQWQCQWPKTRNSQSSKTRIKTDFNQVLHFIQRLKILLTNQYLMSGSVHLSPHTPLRPHNHHHIAWDWAFWLGLRQKTMGFKEMKLLFFKCYTFFNLQSIFCDIFYLLFRGWTALPSGNTYQMYNKTLPS